MNQGWKTKAKRAKLDNHVMHAENNAEAAIAIAEAKVAEAVLATYEAIEAHIACNESGGGQKH